MALFHFAASQIKRSAGQSVVVSAAYRSEKKLHSDYYGEDSDCTRKKGVIYSEILLPPHVPRAFVDRKTLWISVELIEHGKKAQLAYSFEISLQNEFSLYENIALARKFLLDNFVSRGMTGDVTFHEKETEKGEFNRWTKATNAVVHILGRREYTGCTVNFKTYTNSIWDKQQRETPH